MSGSALPRMALLLSLLLALSFACQPTATTPAAPAAPPAATKPAEAPKPAAAQPTAAPAAKEAAKPAGGAVNDAAIKELYEKAKAEGEVVIWGPADNTVDWLPDAFGQKFPGVKVTWVADNESVTKLIAEDRAGRHGVDVFHFSLGGMLPLNERKMLGANEWAAFGVDPSNVMFDGGAAATHNLVYSILVNRNLVSAQDAPRTWDALLDPKWKGKIATSDFLLPRGLAFLAMTWGEEKAIDWARKFRDTMDPLITRAPMDTILVAGERPIGLAQFVSTAHQWQDQGKPIDWVPLSPTGATQFAIAPLAKAPHPNAAKLLAGFIASDEGKATREKLRHDADVRPGSKSAIAQKLREANVEIIFEEPSNMQARADYYTKLAAIITGQTR